MSVLPVPFTTVRLDPSIADWTPECWLCKRRIETWDEALGLPAASTGVEDDEPDTLVFIHLSEHCQYKALR